LKTLFHFGYELSLLYSLLLNGRRS
jgi:hypothetical protein